MPTTGRCRLRLQSNDLVPAAHLGSIAAAARHAATLDILVNNAGVSGDGKTPDQEDAATFRRIYATNVSGCGS